MALLSETKSSRCARVALILMALSAAGCMLFSSKETKEEAPLGLAFSHKVHVAQGIECSDCHPGATGGAEPGLPRRQQCMLCHKEIDEKKPPEKQIAQLFDGDTFVAQHASRVSAETIFPHAKHAAAEKNCAACHTGIEESDRIVKDAHFTMARCQECHAQYKVADDCATCHREIRREWEPPSHEHNWKLNHGHVVRAETGELTDNCAMCHRESTCVTCHLEVPPPNHNNFWRLRGHAVLASMDRQNCAACHRPDSCQRCHEAELPLNHTGMWGAPKDTHCLSCHFPLPTNGCITCHKSTPSHDTATPLPSSHNPGMNCRQCHGVTQPLPHVDNGSNCIMCHH